MIKIRNFIYKDDTVVLKLGLIGWLILYITYVLTHKIPVNPAGFYLESARQLIQNNFQIPEFVTGFGEHGIPFAYPPIGVYVYALVGKLLGNLPAAGLLIPGLLLPMQAFAGYLFVKQFTG